mgnify:CR=1 FL=1
MKIIWMVLFAFALTSIYAPAWAIEIFYPKDMTSFIKSNYLIAFMGEDLDVDQVNVVINGVESGYIDISGADYRSYFADKLILEPEFDLGENVILLQGSTATGEIREARATVYYLGDDPMARAPKNFAPFIMHKKEHEQKCGDCHDMNPDRVALSSISMENNPCASCHRRMLNDSYVHGPAGVFRCVYCHRDSSMSQKYLVPQEAQLCMECHEEKIGEFKSRKYVHGPVAVGLCLACHDPHASSFPAQLRSKTNDTCLSCHVTVVKNVHVGRGVGGGAHPLRGVDDPLRRGRELSCASCHDPHSGEGRSLFIRGEKGRFALCQHCHQK